MLKNKAICATLILTMILLTGGAFTSLAAPQYGFFDDFEGNTIIGWGWNPSQPNTAVSVDVTITNDSTGEVVKEFTPMAITHRNDLIESGVGNGTHGFRISMNWDSLPDGTYTIEGSVDGNAFDNVKTYTKGEVAQEVAPAEAATTGTRSLGLFRTTGYCPCYQCSEGWGRKTSTGATAHANHTIAVDPRVIPYGTRIMINGVVYTAEDRGGGVKGNHIDIFFDSHSQTLNHGSRMQEVFILN